MKAGSGFPLSAVVMAGLWFFSALTPSTGLAWQDSVVDGSAEQSTTKKAASTSGVENRCVITDPVAGDQTTKVGDVGTESDPDTSTSTESDPTLSCYSETAQVGPSAQSVESDLAASDQLKPALFPMNLLDSRLNHYYNFRDDMRKYLGLAFTTDYSALGQRATATLSGEDEAASQVFRVLGTWLSFGDKAGPYAGHLIWKFEYRGAYGSLPTPRDMGFDTGSVLSTANFKQLGWGVTDLYWRQTFDGTRYAFNIGHMDPGDWADQYPLLNAWTRFLSDAFYNNPTESIPKRGFGIAGQAYINENLYFAGGVHDANGKDGKLDFQSFWGTRELMKWVEFGYRPNHDVNARHNTHIHFWEQDARAEAGTTKSHGVVFTYSHKTDGGAVAFLRTGVSKGDAPQMRRFVGGGASFTILGRDTLGIATSWGSPPDKSLRDQLTSEIFYRVQVTQNLTVTPNFQHYFHPSFNPTKRSINVFGLRVRLTF